MGNINDDDDDDDDDDNNNNNNNNKNNNNSNDNIIIKVSYNYHKKISQNPLKHFLYSFDFDSFIRRRLTDQNKITFAIKYLPMSHLR